MVYLAHRLMSINYGRQGGTRRQESKQNQWRNTVYQFVAHGMLSLLFYITQEHLPRLEPPTPISNQENVLQTRL